MIITVMVLTVCYLNCLATHCVNVFTNVPKLAMISANYRDYKLLLLMITE